MGEVLPNSIQLMAKATQDAGLSVNGTVAEMLALQQAGKVTSSEVLPHFAKRMQQAAQANGGLENAMNSNRVAMNRMTTSFQMAADSFFKSGFGEGLTDMFNSIANFVKENIHLWKALGKIIGSVLKGLAKFMDEIITPAFSAIGSVVHTITNLFGDFAGIIVTIIGAFTPLGRLLGGLTKGLMGTKTAVGGLAKAFGILVAPIMLALGALEEIAEFFSPTGKKTLIGVNIKDIIPDVSKVSGEIQKLQDKAVAQSDKATQVQKVMNTPRTGSFSQATYGAAFAGKAPTQTIQVPIYLDGNAIAEVVAETQPMQDSIDRRMSQNSGSNYD